MVRIVAWARTLPGSNWRLPLGPFGVVPPLAIVVRMCSRRLRQMSRESQRAIGGVAEVLDESIANQRVVRIFGGQAYEGKRFEDASQRIRRFNMKLAVAAAGTLAVTHLIVAVAIAAIIYLAAGQSFAGSTDVGHFIEFIAATGMLLQPLKRLTSINEQVQKGLAACESVFGLIDEKPEDDRGTVVIERARGAGGPRPVGWPVAGRGGEEGRGGAPAGIRGRSRRGGRRDDLRGFSESDHLSQGRAEARPRHPRRLRVTRPEATHGSHRRRILRLQRASSSPPLRWRLTCRKAAVHNEPRRDAITYRPAIRADCRWAST